MDPASLAAMALRQSDFALRQLAFTKTADRPRFE
jgi:hypothetical protein